MYCPKFHILFTVVLTAASSLSAVAQHIIVRGLVKDSITEQILEDATIRLMLVPSYDVIGSKRAGAGFEFERVGKGDYLMVSTSMMSFSCTDYINIFLTK